MNEHVVKIKFKKKELALILKVPLKCVTLKCYSRGSWGIF